MEQQTVRKTYKYKLNPTPEQERELGRVLGSVPLALQHRLGATYHGLATLPRLAVSRYQQAAELKDIRAAMPEYAAIHSHVLQDVLARLDKTYQAFFRRMKAGRRQASPAIRRDRWHSFTYIEYGNGARLDNGFLVLSKIGRIAVRWSRPRRDAQDRHDQQEADGWYVCFSCADVPDSPCPRRTGNRDRPWH